ncbi:Alkaline phosphatase synthesis sensor protein PhoR [compost metagenome]
MLGNPKTEQLRRVQAREELSHALNEQAEDVLQALRLNALILQSVADGIYVLDREEHALYLNQAAERIFGYASGELIGKRTHAILHHSYADGSPYPPEACPITLTLRDGRTRQGDHEVFWRKNGEPVPTEYVCSAILEDGRIVGAVLVFRDVSERLRLERRLQEQNVQLQELDRLKNQFINAISHDLRAPLTSIRGYAELLGEEAGGPMTPRQQAYLQQIEKGVQRLDVMIGDLMDMARADAGMLTLACEDTEFTSLLSEIIASLMPLSEQAGVTLSLSSPSEPIIVTLDARRIGRVLANLLQNAIKFTPAGGCVAVRVRSIPEGLLCEIEDTGPGISAEELPRLFQRYSQLEAGLHKGGAGLGLSISKTIVEAHGGTIGVRSAPGKGSTFWFVLPLRPAATP